MYLFHFLIKVCNIKAYRVLEEIISKENSIITYYNTCTLKINDYCTE